MPDDLLVRARAAVERMRNAEQWVREAYDIITADGERRIANCRSRDHARQIVSMHNALPALLGCVEALTASLQTWKPLREEWLNDEGYQCAVNALQRFVEAAEQLTGSAKPLAPNG